MLQQTIALFGEAEKGEIGLPLLLDTVTRLNDILGNPPNSSVGIPFAIQFLLYRQQVLFIRVEEEGFSAKDYIKGATQLKEHSHKPTALCLPGVGDEKILAAVHPIGEHQKTLIITTERDLYDYLTSLRLR